MAELGEGLAQTSNVDIRRERDADDVVFVASRRVRGSLPRSTSCPARHPPACRRWSKLESVRLRAGPGRWYHHHSWGDQNADGFPAVSGHGVFDEARQGGGLNGEPARRDEMRGWPTQSVSLCQTATREKAVPVPSFFIQLVKDFSWAQKPYLRKNSGPNEAFTFPLAESGRSEGRYQL